MKVKVFHGSKFDFSKIEIHKSYDIGFHCGTVNQAVRRIYDDTIGECNLFNCFIYEINIDVNHSNTITTEDCITWSDYNRVYTEISRCGIELKDCHTLEDIRESLIKNGIHYIRYRNEVEGIGLSYIILTENHDIKKYSLDRFLYQMSLVLQPLNKIKDGVI